MLLTSAAARDSAYGGISPIAVPMPQSKDAGYTFKGFRAKSSKRAAARDWRSDRTTEQTAQDITPHARALYHRHPYDREKTATRMRQTVGAKKKQKRLPQNKITPSREQLGITRDQIEPQQNSTGSNRARAAFTALGDRFLNVRATCILSEKKKNTHRQKSRI